MIVGLHLLCRKSQSRWRPSLRLKIVALLLRRLPVRRGSRRCRRSWTRRTSTTRLFRRRLKTWQQQKELIEGDAEKADTLRWYEGQLKYIKELLPQKIAAVEEERRVAARKVHESNRSHKGRLPRTVRVGPGNSSKAVSSSRKAFRLTFDSSIVERTTSAGSF